MTLDMVKGVATVLKDGLEAEMKKHRGDVEVSQALLRLQQSLGELAALWIRSQEPQADQPDQPDHPGQSEQRSVPETPCDPLTEVSDELAAAVEKQWLWEAGKRRLRLPLPIPPRWCWAQGMTSKRELVAHDALGRHRPFPTLPGVCPTTPESLQSGGLQELFDAYAGVASGRLVILGDPGSGKSATAVLLMLEALAHRSGLDSIQRAKVPVPVLLTTHGWDPRHQGLAEWLADRLTRDYPVMRSSRRGRSIAAELVESGRVALFLDGFDEMGPGLSEAALEALRQQTTFRLVILTRSAEFAAAIGTGKHIEAAAAVELLPIPGPEAATYLENCQTEPAPQQWQRLVAHLRDQPDSVVTQALSTPLNLTLVRDTFQNPAELDELLDVRRFASRDEVERYLLDRFINIVCDGATGPARTALSYLAARMRAHNTRDLAWWQIHHLATPVVRVIAAAAVGALAGAVGGALVFGPFGQYVVRDTTGTSFGAVYLSAMGLLFGFMAGLVSELRASRSRRPRRREWTVWPLRRVNGAAGLLVGVSVMLAVGNQSSYAVGVPAGLLSALVAGLAAARGRPGTGTGWPFQPWWTAWWAAVRSRFDLMAGVAAGLPIGLTYGLTKGPVHGTIAGIVSLVSFGLMVGFSRTSADVTAATDPISSWRRDRRSAIIIGLTSGLALGLPLGIKNGIAHGLMPGIIAATCIGGLVALVCIIGVADTWRANLAFLQLHHQGIPRHAMRFLENARHKRLLRTVGPLYQFLHPNLHDRLADLNQLECSVPPRRYV